MVAVTYKHHVCAISYFDLYLSKSSLALRLRHSDTVYNPLQLLINHNQDLPSTMRIAIAVLALAFVGVSIARGSLLTIGHRIHYHDVKFVMVCQYSRACV